MSEISNENELLVLMGDINIDISNIDFVRCEDYVNCYLTYGLKCIINLPTRVYTNGSATLIDYVLTNCEDITSSGVIPAEITNHFPYTFVYQFVITILESLYLGTYLIVKSMYI